MEPPPFLILLAGGLLTGTAAALFLLVSGRIAGISGLVAAATRIADSDPPWWRIPLPLAPGCLCGRSGRGCYLANPFAPSSFT